MGILENCPFVLRDIMAFLVLEVLSGILIYVLVRPEKF